MSPGFHIALYWQDIHSEKIKAMNIPNAGQPVSSQSKNTHQQDQYSRSVLNVVIQFTSNTTQTEKPDHLQGAEKTADTLKREYGERKRSISEIIFSVDNNNNSHVILES